MTRHYLDHASTTPLRPSARDAMLAALDLPTADPARLHADSEVVRHAIEVARSQVAELFGARPRSVVFTSGATEAAATVVRGVASRGRRQVVGAVEHSCVRDAVDRSADGVTIGVDHHGRVDLDELDGVLATATDDDPIAVVHVQWGNHEVGTLQPVAEVAEQCRAAGVLLHVDAAQAAGRVPIAFDQLGIDLLSVSAHKLGGPPGTGALLVRRGLRIDPLLLGGQQERARRAGMENVPAIAGFGAAAVELAARLDGEAAIQRALTRRLRAGLGGLDGVDPLGHPTEALPHLVCVTLADIEPQAVLLALDRSGIAAHSGSACAAEDVEPSPVLAAMGVPADRSLRFSVGWTSTDADVDAVLRHLPAALADLRALR